MRYCQNVPKYYDYYYETNSHCRLQSWVPSAFIVGNLSVHTIILPGFLVELVRVLIYAVLIISYARPYIWCMVFYLALHHHICSILSNIFIFNLCYRVF